jgi:hypothetical protein
MTENFEFGAYIPESYLDIMEHDEAYITSRINYWLTKKDEVHKTDEELANECRVKICRLKGWKKKVKSNHLCGLDFYISGFPKKKTYYLPLRSADDRSLVGGQPLPRSADDQHITEHKILHKPPISPKGTIPNFIWEEETILNIFRHLFEWRMDGSSLSLSGKTITITTNSFRGGRLEGEMLTNKEFDALRSEHGFTVEIIKK